MVISTERRGTEARLVAALRATFDASVMNFGSYNLLYAENLLGEAAGPQDSAPASSRGGRGEGTAEPGGLEHSSMPDSSMPDSSVPERVSRARHLLVGYRREPVEMILCPVELGEALPRAAKGAGGTAEPSVPLPVNLTNLAGMAVEDSTVELALSTGRRVRLDVQPVVEFAGLAGTELNQRRDVEDFYAFVDYFMDIVETMGR